MFVKNNNFSAGDIVSFFVDNFTGGELIGMVKNESFSATTHGSPTIVIDVRYQVIWRTDGTYTIRDFMPTASDRRIEFTRDRLTLSTTDSETVRRFQLQFGDH